MSISQVAFWGNAKQGSLRCHFQTYQLRPGEITLLLLNLSPAILKNCIQVIDDTLKDSSLPVCELAAISRKIASDLSPIPWFQNLVKVLPVNQEYTQAYEKWNQLNQPTFEHKLLKIASSGDECPAELPSYDAPRRNECLDAFVTSSAWFAWTCYLVDYDDSSTTPRMVSDLFSVDPLPYAKTYLLALKHFLQETQTLLEELPSYLAALNNSRTFQFGKHYTFDISLNSVHFLLSPYGPSEANIFSLTGLVTLELYYLFKGHSRIKQCALCGQIFLRYLLGKNIVPTRTRNITACHVKSVVLPPYIEKKLLETNFLMCTKKTTKPTTAGRASPSKLFLQSPLMTTLEQHGWRSNPRSKTSTWIGICR